ncbi:MAG: metallophosphoesterase family protein [Sphingobacteriaceae bacterium]
MKRIGLISDTHGYLDESVFGYFAECDEIWHAGDFGTIELADQLAAFKPMRGVYGNIDGQEVRIVYPEHIFFMCENIKVWITHIGGYPGRYPAKIKETLLRQKPDLFICGHSHILKVMHDPKMHLLHLNPGAAGKHGWHKMRTLLRFSVSDKKIHNLEAIELGIR